MMQAGSLAESGLLEFLCRPSQDADREAVLQAAANACLSVPGVCRAWAAFGAQTAEVPGDPAAERYPFGVEVPVDVAGHVCGTVGLETAAPVSGSAHRRAVAVAELLATWEARRRLGDDGSRQTIVGCSDGIRDAELLARRYAGLEEPVLIQGETGVGKELIARTLHCLSPRKDLPLSIINCAAVPDELIASELFGHRRGSFTGAIRCQRGRFEIADGATLFLDEIGEMGPSLQAALLRVLESGEVQQIGDEGRMRRIDVRVIAATNRDVAAEVAAGRFRSDLYYRLTPLSLEVPPLRHRLEDIPVLARYFVQMLEGRWGRSLEIVSDALRSMRDYPFPGNVRELRNLVLRAAAASYSGRIESIPLPPPVAIRGNARRSRVPVLATPTAAPGADGNGRAHAVFRADGNWHSNSNGHSHSDRQPNGSGPTAGSSGTSGSSSAWSGGVFPASDLAILSPGLVAARSFPKTDGDGHRAKAEALSLDGATAAHLRKVLSIAKGNVSQAARMLDIPRTTLQSKLRRYGVQ